MPAATGKRVVGYASIYVGGTIIQRALGLLLVPVVTRVLGVQEYGVVGTAAALGSLLATIYGLGLNFSIVRFYYDEPRDVPRAGWASLVRAQGLAALALAAITYATGPWWSSLFHSIGWAPAFKVAIVVAWITAMQTTAQGVLRVMQRPGAFLAVTAVQVIVATPLSIAFATQWGAVGYMTGIGIGSACALAASLTLSYRAPRWSRTLLVSAVALSLPAMVHQLASWGIDLADRLLVAVYLGTRDVGRYNLAYTIGSILVILLTSIQAAWSPYFIGNLTPEARRKIPRLLVLPASTLTWAVTAVLVIAAPLALTVLAPGSFGGTEVVIALVAASSMPRAAYFMAVTVLVDKRESKWMGTASFAGLVLNVGLNVALIPTFGLVAAAAATAVAVAMQATVVIWVTERLLEVEMRIWRLWVAWSIGTALLVALAVVPESTGGYVARGACLLLVLPAAFAAAQWLRAAFAEGVRTDVPDGQTAPALA